MSDLRLLVISSSGFVPTFLVLFRSFFYQVPRIVVLWSSTRVITNFLLSLFLSYCVHVCVPVFVLVCVLDPTPLLEASYSLEERLAQLKSSSPDIEVLVKEILGHWRRHLECLNSAGQLPVFYSTNPTKVFCSNQNSKNTGQYVL